MSEIEREQATAAHDGASAADVAAPEGGRRGEAVRRAGNAEAIERHGTYPTPVFPPPRGR